MYLTPRLEINKSNLERFISGVKLLKVEKKVKQGLSRPDLLTKSSFTYKVVS